MSPGVATYPSPRYLLASFILGSSRFKTTSLGGHPLGLILLALMPFHHYFTLASSKESTTLFTKSLVLSLGLRPLYILGSFTLPENDWALSPDQRMIKTWRLVTNLDWGSWIYITRFLPLLSRGLYLYLLDRYPFSDPLHDSPLPFGPEPCNKYGLLHHDGFHCPTDKVLMDLTNT